MSAIPSSWVEIDTDTSTLVTATKTAIANHRHSVSRISVSFDIASVNSVVVTVNSGATVLDRFEVSVGSIGTFLNRDYTHALRGGTNEAITVVVPDAGASVVCTAVVGGYTRSA